MTIYMIEANLYDHFKYCDHGGFVEKRFFFKTEERAQKWIEDNKNKTVNGEEIYFKYQTPEFTIKEIEIIE